MSVGCRLYVTLLDVQGQNYRSTFQQRIRFSISKPQHKNSPSVKRQTWTITRSTEKKRKDWFFFYRPTLGFFLSRPKNLLPWWNFLQVTEAKKSEHFQMQRRSMSHSVLAVFPSSPAGRAADWLFHWKISISFFFFPLSLLSNSSLAPCCRLLEKAEKRSVTQRSHVFGWDDTPPTASKIMMLYFVCLLVC